MTAQEKQTILDMRNKGKSYAQIAQETGMARSTVSSFCQKNRPEGLLSEPARGNTVCAESLENKRPEASEKVCSVTRVFADEPDPGAITDVLGMLMNAR